jgi:hypothetical protein
MLDRTSRDSVCATVDSLRGYNAERVEPLKDAVETAHQVIFGKPTEPAGAPECSMWRDINPYNEVGIPSLTYGCGAGGGRRQHLFHRR